MPNSLPEETLRILSIEDDAQRRMAMALHASDIGVFEIEPASDFSFWDNAMYGFWGVEPGTAVTYDTVLNAIHPEDRYLHVQTRQQAMDPSGTGDLDITFRVTPYDGSPTRWLRSVAHCFFEDDVPLRLVGTVQDVTAQQEHEAQETSLLHELEHRVKNTLAAALAVVDLSRAQHQDIDTYFDVVSARLRAMALSHDVLRRLDWKDAPLEKCVLLESDSFLAADSSRFSLTGPTMLVAAHNVLTVGMVFHELFTNAAKYGALSQPEGFITMTAEPIPGATRLTWSEHGGPPITEPPQERTGFGAVLLHQIFTAETGATVTQTFPGEGMRLVIDYPLTGTSTSSL